MTDPLPADGGLTAFHSVMDKVEAFSVVAPIGTHTYISTGCTLLDAYLGDRVALAGYPTGTIVELYGAEGVGKTTLATAAMASVCNGNIRTVKKWIEPDASGRSVMRAETVSDSTPPGFILFMDSEFKWDRYKAVRAGVDLSRIRMLDVEAVEAKKGEISSDFITTEAALSHAQQAFRMLRGDGALKDSTILVVWDSLAATPTASEASGAGIYDQGVASKARLIRAAMRKLAAQLFSFNVTFLVVNQVYEQIGSPGLLSSGGRGVKFHSSLRLSVKKPKDTHYGPVSEAIGIMSRVTSSKSAFCAPNFDIEIPLLYKAGVDDVACNLFQLIDAKHPAISKGGAGYITINIPGRDPLKVQGVHRAVSELDADAIRYLKQAVVESLR